MSERNYVKDFEASLDAWYAELKANLKKLDGGNKTNWSATKRIRVESRKFPNIYTEFRDASNADEAAYYAEQDSDK